ncbi:FkbM family methyltransferase [Halorientalis marina]|uniref:FkbM family methyltransferase n=1 Tax=Halorientalis marina TaxID=2931976 RepID=UPI001FF2A605|nr:FkbM family methyltransferase [Halorientalis marina]
MPAQKILDQVRRTVYNSPIYTILGIIGLRSPVTNLYWRLQFALSDDTITRTVGPSTAKFHILTRHEFSRFNDPTLHGEIEVLSEIIESLESDNVFYDVGANVGLHACFAGQITTSGSIVAIEPHPKSAKRLKENLELNNITGEVCEYALASEYDTAVLELSEDRAGAVGSVEMDERENGTNVEIDLVPGDNVIRSDEIPAPDVMKIDVDGGEMEVLRGLEDTLRNQSCRLIFCEIHPDALLNYGATEEDVRDLLIDLGYEISERDVSHDSREGAYFVRAEKDI